MITGWLIGLVVSVLSAINGFLPSLSLPSWMTSDAWSAAIVNTVGGMLGAMSGWFPVDALLSVLIGVLTLLPIIAGYVVFDWVWKHVPVIAGFGT